MIQKNEPNEDKKSPDEKQDVREFDSVLDEGKNHKDQGLIGNEEIERYLMMLQESPSDELLAILLSTIRRRMQEGGQLVIAVQMRADGGLNVETKEIKGKGNWFLAYTSFDEQMKKKNGVMSTFMADMKQLFEMALADDSISGIVLNAWGAPLLMNRMVLELITKQ